MRDTYGTIAATTCAILVLATFWPQPEGPVIRKAAAQAAVNETADAAPPSNTDDGKPENGVPFQGSKERIEAKLAEPLPRVDYFQMTFQEVIFDLSQTTGLTIAIDPSLLQGEINTDELIDLQFPENAVSAQTLLQLAFKALQSDDYLGYTIRDNIVLITSKEATTEVVIYNCRDLIYPAPPQAARMDGEGSEIIVNSQFGGGGFGGGGGGGLGGGIGGEEMYGGAPGMGMMPATPEQQLIEVITGTVEADSWANAGGPGSTQSINGLIVINHTREVHDKVKNLLQLLREAMKEGVVRN